MNIKIIKFKNSEEILCEIINNDNEETITIKNPCVLVPSGQTNIAMAPWLPFADMKDGVSIPKDNVMVTINVIEEIALQYEQQFGSNLIKPNSKIVTPNDLKLTT